MVDGLDIPVPFDVEAFCRTIGDRRGRPIRPLARDLDRTQLYGMWVAMADVDWIVHERRTSRLHQQHIILHELGHLLCGHEAASVMREETSRLLLGELDPGVVRRILGRSRYTQVEEREAELVASLILERVSPWSRPASRDVPAHAVDLASHVEASLLPPAELHRHG